MKTASWIIREKATGAVVMETFNEKVIEKINAEKYEAVPILEYLASINGRRKPDADKRGENR